MSSVKFFSPEFLGLFIFIPIIFFTLRFAKLKRDKERDLLISAKTQSNKFIHQRIKRNRLQNFFILAALCFMVIALAEPAWNPHETNIEKEGRDVFFVLDVSKSMLAEDCSPNRLDAAKHAIEQSLSVMQGNRVSLLAFAGSSSIRCPLTKDHLFFRKMLREVGTDSVSQGGTRIGDALHKVLDKLMNKKLQGNQDIILISDGEDMDPQTQKAIRKMNERDARFIVIGLGDEEFGSRIPINSETQQTTYLKHEGREVWSKLNSKSLSQLSSACDKGVYYPIGVSPFDLSSIYKHLRALMPQEVRKTGSDLIYDRGHRLFSSFAAICLFFSLAVTLQVRTLTCFILTFSLLDWPIEASELNFNNLTPTHKNHIKSGLQFLKENNFKEAESSFQIVVSSNPGLFIAHYNLAYSQYRNRDFGSSQYEFFTASKHSSSVQNILKCQFNQARCFIELAKLAEIELEEMENEEDDIIPPESYYNEAIKLYRNILRQDESYNKAAVNLELILRKLYQEHDEESLAQDQNKQQQKDSDQNNEEMNNQEQDGPQDNKREKKTTDKNNSKQMKKIKSPREIRFDDLNLPPPALSPEDILKEEQQNNAMRSKKKGKKAQKVEKDW